MKSVLPVALLLLSLAACSGGGADDDTLEPPSASVEDDTSDDINAQPPATAPVPTPAPEAPAPMPPVTPDPGSGLAHFDGYGDLRFGMTADEAKMAWGGDLKAVPNDAEACHYLKPISVKVTSDFALMIENGKFVRYGVGNAKELAPGGGRNGMTADDIRKLYAGRIEEQPHKYVEGGKYLRIKDAAGSNGVLLFEADAAGKITSWRAGVAPQVDYVEGCS